MTGGFKSEYSHSIDSKGRVIVPAKFRESLGESFVITKNFDGCLCMYPFDEWEAFELKLRQLPESKNGVRKLKRHFIGGAAECELDKQGRVLIPSSLREYAQLIKDVLFIGMGDKVEVWDKERYEEYKIDNAEALDEIMDEEGIVF